MSDVVDGLEGWVVERRRSRYTLGYWALFVIGMLGQFVPDAPPVTYTLRNTGSGERRVITLQGDHKPSDLVEAVDPVQTDPAEQIRHGRQPPHKTAL